MPPPPPAQLILAIPLLYIGPFVCCRHTSLAGEGGLTRGYPSNLGDHTNVWGDIPLIDGGMMLEYMGSVDTGDGE